MADHGSLAEALAAFQAELPTIVKTETAKVAGKEGRQGYEYGYADLAAVAQAVLPVLGRHGLSYSSRLTRNDRGQKILLCRLLHVTGEEDVSEWDLTDTTNPQALGSLITYGRRYCLLLMTGAHPAGEDDDGLAARDNAAAREGRYAPDPKQEEAYWLQQIANVPDDLDELTKLYHRCGRADRMTEAVKDAFVLRGGAIKQQMADAAQAAADAEAQRHAGEADAELHAMRNGLPTDDEDVDPENDPVVEETTDDAVGQPGTAAVGDGDAPDVDEFEHAAELARQQGGADWPDTAQPGQQLSTGDARADAREAARNARGRQRAAARTAGAAGGGSSGSAEDADGPDRG